MKDNKIIMNINFKRDQTAIFKYNLYIRYNYLIAGVYELFKIIKRKNVQ